MLISSYKVELETI